VTSTEELGDGSLGTKQISHAPAEGDDIVVIPGGAPDEPRGRQLLLIIGAAVVSIGVIVAAIAILNRHDGKTAQVAVQPPAPTAPVARQPATLKPKPKPLPSKPAPTVVGSTPATQPARVPVSLPVVSSPAQQPPPTLPLPPPKQYGPSALTWNAPHEMTIAAGRTAPLTVVAFNRTDGIVNLPHPLACTPRLDHAEVCTEVLQTIQPGGSATATYAIDARGIAPGKYTLQIEGVLTVLVTVS
jgi:hypothetical protein